MDSVLRPEESFDADVWWNSQLWPRVEASPNKWKDPTFVDAWKKQFFERWKKDQSAGVVRNPLLDGVSIGVSVDVKQVLELKQAREFVTYENETLSERAHRTETRSQKKQVSNRSPAQARHQIPDFLAIGAGGEWLIAPAARRAPEKQIAQAKAMYELGLEVKAQRKIACNVIGGEVQCKGCKEKFLAAYECHGRYCPHCGPLEANKLFKRKFEKLFFVSQSLMLCGEEECEECNQALAKRCPPDCTLEHEHCLGELPHWPPQSAKHASGLVCATLDFMLKDTGRMPTNHEVKQFNKAIRRFWRRAERRFGIKGRYGFAWCCEFGEANSNLHAHGIYVGPRLPQSSREGKRLSALWLEVTGDSFIVTMSKAAKVPESGRDSFAVALWHAVKYPAKFAELSPPERLAELEAVFHDVKRFHCMGKFYNPQAPESKPPEKPKCPCCDGELGLSDGWETIPALRLRGLVTVEEKRKALGKECACGVGGSPSIKHK